MSDVVRENEIKALERMNSTLILARTVFPSDREILSSWFDVIKNMKECIEEQQKKIDKKS